MSQRTSPSQGRGLSSRQTWTWQGLSRQLWVTLTGMGMRHGPTHAGGAHGTRAAHTGTRAHGHRHTGPRAQVAHTGTRAHGHRYAGPRTRAAHTGRVTSRWPLRGWASDLTARGLQHMLAAWGPPSLPAALSAPTGEALLQSHQSSTLDAKAAVSAESCKTLWIRNSRSGFWIYVRGTRYRIRNGVFQNNFACSAEKHFFSPCISAQTSSRGPCVSKAHHTSLPGKEMCFVLPRMEVPGCGSWAPLRLW